MGDWKHRGLRPPGRAATAITLGHSRSHRRGGHGGILVRPPGRVSAMGRCRAAGRESGLSRSRVVEPEVDAHYKPHGPLHAPDVDHVRAGLCRLGTQSLRLPSHQHRPARGERGARLFRGPAALPDRVAGRFRDRPGWPPDRCCSGRPRLRGPPVAGRVCRVDHRASRCAMWLLFPADGAAVLARLRSRIERRAGLEPVLLGCRGHVRPRIALQVHGGHVAGRPAGSRCLPAPPASTRSPRLADPRSVARLAGEAALLVRGRGGQRGGVPGAPWRGPRDVVGAPRSAGPGRGFRVFGRVLLAKDAGACRAFSTLRAVPAGARP